jgi:hypothetical protein
MLAIYGLSVLLSFSQWDNEMELKEAINISRSLMECIETLLQCSDGRIVLWTEDMDMQLELDSLDAEATGNAATLYSCPNCRKPLVDKPKRSRPRDGEWRM